MRKLRQIPLVGAGLLLGLSARAAENPSPEALAGLLQNSPFGAQATPGRPADAAAPLEFRSTFTDKGEAFFSLYEGATRSSRWVGLNEAGNPFTVRSYDAVKGEVVVDYQGRVLTLGLKQARVTVLAPPPPAPPAVAPGPGTGNPAPAVAVAAAGTPEEAARLAQIAEEIRRRRALRQQVLSNPPTPPK